MFECSIVGMRVTPDRVFVQIVIIREIRILMEWKLLSSEYLFTDNWLTLRKDTCERADGHIVSPYYVYEFSTWVTAVCITTDNQMVMVKQYRHALGEVCIETPGGCVDDTDRDLQAAIAREILEETGYRFEHYEYLGKVSPNPSTNNNLMHMFLATGGIKESEQALDHNEEIEVVLYTIDEVKQLLRENRIMQAMHICCILYAFEKLGYINY
jgi:8-oxo-dGTP pyrophosphatase MutT (NUDIX family)